MTHNFNTYFTLFALVGGPLLCVVTILILSKIEKAKTK